VQPSLSYLTPRVKTTPILWLGINLIAICAGMNAHICKVDPLVGTSSRKARSKPNERNGIRSPARFSTFIYIRTGTREIDYSDNWERKE